MRWLLEWAIEQHVFEVSNYIKLDKNWHKYPIGGRINLLINGAILKYCEFNNFMDYFPPSN